MAVLIGVERDASSLGLLGRISRPGGEESSESFQAVIRRALQSISVTWMGGKREALGGTPLAARGYWRLPSGLGPLSPSTFLAGRSLTNFSPAQAIDSVISSSNTAKASLSWSRLRAVTARRNRH